MSGVRVATPLVIHPRWEPYAGKPLVRFRAGGDQRWSSLPQHTRSENDNRIRFPGPRNVSKER
jgi:hypothetical protein